MAFDTEYHEYKINFFQILKKWEILRIPYNCILILIIVVGIWPVWCKIPNHKIFLIENIISLIQANILYFGGPFLEVGIKYFKKDISRYRKIIWLFGMFLSILITFYSILMVYNRYG
jgi:hypothetical protein